MASHPIHPLNPTNWDRKTYLRVHKLFKLRNRALADTASGMASDYMASDYMASDYIASDYMASDYMASDYIASDYMASDYVRGRGIEKLKHSHII